MSKLNLLNTPTPLLHALVNATEYLAENQGVTILSKFYEAEMRKVFPENFVIELAKRAGDHLLTSVVVERYPEFTREQVSGIVSQVIEEVMPKDEGFNG